MAFEYIGHAFRKPEVDPEIIEVFGEGFAQSVEPSFWKGRGFELADVQVGPMARNQNPEDPVRQIIREKRRKAASDIGKLIV